MKTVRPFLPALAYAAALTCVFNACSDDPPPPVEAEPATQQRPAAPAPAPADLEASAEEVPIVEDFEDEAEQEVKPDNLNAQLDALEQEIELDSK